MALQSCGIDGWNGQERRLRKFSRVCLADMHSGRDTGGKGGGGTGLIEPEMLSL